MRSRTHAALLAAFALVVSLVPAAPVAVGTGPPQADRPPYLNPKLPVHRRVDDLLSRMTLEEKIGQMTQAERGAVTDNPSLIAEWKLGSVLSGGGSTPTPNTP